jgi:hypothetical protein
MPHPRGFIHVKLARTGSGISGVVELPAGVGGRFVFGGKEIALKGGKQEIMIADGAQGVHEKKKADKARVIFDTDMGPDYDDVGAIALLHAFADSGKATLLATMASNKYEGVAAVLNLFNTYFGRPDIPIGVPKGDAVSQRDTQHWTDSILARYPHRIVRNEQAADAVQLYREILSRQPDHSVVIITVGFLTNLKGLLETGPDSFSSLNGRELVRLKVKRLVSMAGKFPEGWEFNVMKDVAASQAVFSSWPTPILLSGFGIGVKIKCGLPLIRNEAVQNDPVKDVFRIGIPLAAEDSAGRSSWDETAVLVGIGGYAPYYTVQRGKMSVNSDGSDKWKADNAGPQAHLIEARPVREVKDLIDRMMAHQPRSKPLKPSE